MTERRAEVDFAQAVRTLAEEGYPSAEELVRVLDDLGARSPAALYEALQPAAARRLAARLGIRYAPGRASWLGKAGAGLSALARRW